MPVMFIRYQVADEGVSKVVGAVEKTFAALKAKRPDGIRYAYARRAGGNEFVAVLAMDEGIENPLFGIEAARELQQTVAKLAVGEPPMPQPLELLGSYGFAG